jgi:putative aldouronate transport system permease protein
MRLNWDVYLIALPGLALLLTLNYIPMYGITIAFKDFNIFQGILGSDWSGFENFIRLTYSDEFKRAFVNTFTLSVLSLLWGMPFPIILSLLLNECRKLLFKRSVQTM